MNKQKILFKLIISSIGLIFYSHLILTLFYTIWISKKILILYYICFYLLSICYFFIILLEIPYLGNKIYDYIGISGIILYLIIFIILILFEIIVLGVNLSKFSNYWKNCPFTINEPYENLHYKRRCELYNINNNSRYKYQYICSYNAYKDFTYVIKSYILNGKLYFYKEEYNKLYKFIQDNHIKCILFRSVILNNSIVNLFNKEYLNDNKYYCGRTNQPQKNNYIKDKECNNKFKKNIFYIFYILCISQIFYAILYGFIKNYEEKDNNLGIIRNQVDIPNKNKKSLSSTNITDKNDNNINFKKLNTKNIIYINKKEININKNIKNIYIDNNYKINNINNINMEEIYKIRKENNSY